MRPSADIRPITYIKTHSADLIKEVNRRKSPIVITQNGEAKAVVLDINSYEKQKDVFLMMKLILQGEKDVRAKNLISQDEYFKNIEENILK